MKRGHDTTNKEEATTSKKKKGGSQKSVTSMEKAPFSQAHEFSQEGQQSVIPSSSSSSASVPDLVDAAVVKSVSNGGGSKEGVAMDSAFKEAVIAGAAGTVQLIHCIDDSCLFSDQKLLQEVPLTRQTALVGPVHTATVPVAAVARSRGVAVQPLVFGTASADEKKPVSDVQVGDKAKVKDDDCEMKQAESLLPLDHQHEARNYKEMVRSNIVGHFRSG